MRRRGFTLIELLVVIAIIGLLATIVTSNFSDSRAKSRDARRVADIQTLQLALNQYYSDKGYYPLYLGELVPTYIQKLPTDPSYNTTSGCSPTNNPGADCYIYTPYRLPSAPTSCGTMAAPTNFPNKIKYHLGAKMEQGSDKNAALKEDADWADDQYVDACGSLGQYQTNFLGQSANPDCPGPPTARIEAPNGYEEAVNNVTPPNDPNTIEYCYDVTN